MCLWILTDVIIFTGGSSSGTQKKMPVQHKSPIQSAGGGSDSDVTSLINAPTQHYPPPIQPPPPPHQPLPPIPQQHMGGSSSPLVPPSAGSNGSCASGGLGGGGSDGPGGITGPGEWGEEKVLANLARPSNFTPISILIVSLIYKFY